MLNARDVNSTEDARNLVTQWGCDYIKVGLFDLDGVMRGKYMSQDKFLSALDKGFGFCDVVLGWDSKDQLYDNVSFTGWHTGYPDAQVRIVPDSCREIPFEDNRLLFLAEFDEGAADICPRRVLHRVIARAHNMGFDPFAAMEYEFFLFNETPESVRAKGYKNLNSFTPDWFGYSMLRNSVHSDLYQQILDLAQQMDFPIEGIHTETGPGVLEAAIAVDSAANAADKGALFKTFIKVLAQRNDMLATFMAKWSPDYPGQSGHIHVSLQHRDGSGSAFHAEGEDYCMSRQQRQFLAGQQKLMPELLAMIAPTVNSYTRLVPGFWAPTEATWGVENRTTALRVVPGGPEAQRIEYRVGAADANPHLALAAAIGSGLYGIEHDWEPEPQVKGNAYEQEHPESLKLPATLWEAAQKLHASEAARDLFGSAFVNHFAASREWEEREFRKHVSDWEMERYFEII